LDIRSGNPISSGKPLDQVVRLAGSQTMWLITFESRGGSRRQGTARNTQYATAVELVLERLAAVGAMLEGAYLVSSTVRAWPEEMRRLSIAGGYPRTLLQGDAEQLRLELARAQSADRFRSPGSRGVGNGTKRMELRVALPTALTGGQVADLIFQG
jgi:hypothetical protein